MFFTGIKGNAIKYYHEVMTPMKFAAKFDKKLL
jgi:hypothetical protein